MKPNKHDTRVAMSRDPRKQLLEPDDSITRALNEIDAVQLALDCGFVEIWDGDGIETEATKVVAYQATREQLLEFTKRARKP